MLIDEFVPEPELDVAVHRLVRARPEVVWAAIDTADLGRDALVRVLGTARDLPNRMVARVQGQPVEATPTSFRFSDVTGEWVDLGVRPGVEQVHGAIGRFWQRDYGWVAVTPEEFAAFAEPGYAKTVAGLSVRPYGDRRTLVSFDSRTVCTDDEARRRMARYWRPLRPFARLLMARCLAAVAAEAESAPQPPAPAVDLVSAESSA